MPDPLDPRRRILARRARFIAATVAGVGASIALFACDRSASDEDVKRDRYRIRSDGASVPTALVDAGEPSEVSIAPCLSPTVCLSPTACLEIARPPDGGYAGPCLSIARPPKTGPDSGTPRVCLSPVDPDLDL